MAPLKAALDTKKRSIKEKQQKNSSLLSYSMRRDYTLEPVDYDVHHRDVKLVELFDVIQLKMSPLISFSGT